MKNLALLFLFLLLPTLALAYPKEVDDLNTKLYSMPKSQNDTSSIVVAIQKIENLSGSDIEKQTYSNIANTIRIRLDKEPKKNKNSKFKNWQNIIDAQKASFSSTDPDYLASTANLIMAAIQYASLGNVIEYSKQAVNLYEAALKINPNHFESLLGYGILRGYQPSFVGGGMDKCLVHFEKAVASAKTNAEKYQIYIWISQAYFEKKDYNNYNKYFNLASQIYPNGAFTTILEETNADKKSIFDEPIVSE